MTDAIPADLADLSLMTVASMIAERDISPVDVTKAVVDRIEAKNSTLNAFITVLSEQAMDSARNAESEIARGGYRGPLHGVPISVKDLFWTAGVRTTAGSRVLGQYIPEENATVVERLHDAGAILVGKTTMEEFAFPCVHPDYGPALNPWDLSRTPGGSSSGSAVAVAAGMGFGSLGTDTGGSIRIPAAYCGIVGLKPTYGRVSRYGVIPASWTADHVGPMTRTVADGAAMLSVIAGVDARDRTSSRQPVPDYVANLSQDIAGLRIGISNVYDEEVY